MQNGIGNNDASALSPDHANSVEPVLADRIEALPAAFHSALWSGRLAGWSMSLTGASPGNAGQALQPGCRATLRHGLAIRNG
jgi:iron complex outermembrane receptor protein